MELQPESDFIQYNKDHWAIVSAHRQGNIDIKLRMLTEFLRTQDHPHYTLSRLKELAKCFFYQDYAGKGAPAPGSSKWSKAQWRERISHKFMEMYAGGWLDLEYGSNNWRGEDGNVDIAAYPSVKATIETMRRVLASGTLEQMDEHWNLTLPLHYLTLGFIYRHGFRVVEEPGKPPDFEKRYRYPNDFEELYKESWGPDSQRTAIKDFCHYGDNAAHFSAPPKRAGSPAESDAGETLDALRKRNSTLNERCKMQQIIMEQNAEQIKLQERKIEDLTALNELAADKIDPLMKNLDEAKSLASQLQVAEAIMEQNAEQIKSQERKIDELTAVIAQQETGQDRVDQQPVNQSESLDILDDDGVIDIKVLTQGMGELMCKDEKLKEVMERLYPNAPPLDEDKIKKSGEAMRKKIKIKKKKKEDKQEDKEPEQA